MSLKDVKPGAYRAKAVGGAWEFVGVNKTPCVKVGFEFVSEGTTQKITHTLWLTDKANEEGVTATQRSMDILIGKLGYNADKDLLKSQDGLWFDKTYLADKEVEIVIEQITYEGKPQTRIKWVNDLGGAQMGGVSVKEVLGNKDIRQLAAAARARMGVKKVAPATQNGTLATGSFNESDVPF